MRGIEQTQQEARPDESVWHVHGAVGDRRLHVSGCSVSSAMNGKDVALGTVVDSAIIEDEPVAPDLGQRRPGTRHAGGGRTIGTETRTRATMTTGYARALSLAIEKFSVDDWLLAIGPDSDAAEPST